MNIFKFEFKRGIKSMVIWSVISLLLIGLFVAIFPSIKDSGMQEIVNTKMDAMPSGVLEAVNLTSDIDLTKISDYLAYCLQYVGMAAGIYGAILGTAALIKEESEGTIEFLYAKPIKRRDIVINKLLANATLFISFISIVTLGTMLMTIPVIPEEANMIDVLTDIKVMFIGMAILGYIFMTIGFLLSTVIKSSKSAITIGIGVFFATYVLGMAGKLQEGLELLKYLSPMEYIQPTALIKEGFDTTNMILATTIIIISIIGTFIIYNKKDMKI